MPRKTLKQRKERELQRRPTSDSSNRVRNIVNDLIGTEDPEDLMMKIMETLDASGFIPYPGKLYTFVYNAKTPGLVYDQHPLILANNVYQFGFDGYNFHWSKPRRYTWNEVIGQLYEVQREELADMRRIPYAKFLLNS
jgi:hypothetical protein|tara:strand:- start:1766 stop:2179 length:414 start_codon:yes stop_codon:yes gene_type:complete